MNTIKTISKYLLIVFIWTFIAIFIARIQYDTSDLNASILSLTEQDFFKSTKRDAGYKRENQIFEIFLSENIKNEWPLNISIIYSPTDIELFVENITSNYSVNITQQNKWILKLTIDWYQNYNSSEWIIQIPYSWDSKDITLEYIKSKNVNFTIWNLDNVETDNQSH